MFKRLHIYLKEMYPIVPRLAASFGLFAGIYATTLFVAGKQFEHIGWLEVIGILTVFGVLLSLRIADEFKDYETDKVNFPKRPLPSGRVKKKDLIMLATVVVGVMAIVNIAFMPNPLFFLAIAAYGTLMTKWFFARKYIQPNLLLALVTHNPVQLLIVYYVMSIAAATYGFSVWTWQLFLVAFVFYLPGLAWELSRKIRAPKEEDQYVTYSQIFGRTRAIVIVLAVFLIQLIAVTIVFLGQAWWIVAVSWLLYLVYVGASIYNAKKPESINYGKIARAYMYAFQAFLVVASILAII